MSNRALRALGTFLVVVLFASIAQPAVAANPYNAKGYMNTSGDYAGVFVDNNGAGVIAVRAEWRYTPPSGGSQQWWSATKKDTTVNAGLPVTSGYPSTSLQYTSVLAFRGCSGSGTSCTLGPRDTQASSHVFS